MQGKTMIGALGEYRLFAVNERGDVRWSRLVLCTDGKEAAELAAATAGNGWDVEVWDVGRFFAKVRRNSLTSRTSP
jgi:hypothetical protein